MNRNFQLDVDMYRPTVTVVYCRLWCRRVGRCLSTTSVSIQPTVAWTCCSVQSQQTSTALSDFVATTMDSPPMTCRATVETNPSNSPHNTCMSGFIAAHFWHYLQIQSYMILWEIAGIFFYYVCLLFAAISHTHNRWQKCLHICADWASQRVCWTVTFTRQSVTSCHLCRVWRMFLSATVRKATNIPVMTSHEDHTHRRQLSSTQCSRSVAVTTQTTWRQFNTSHSHLFSVHSRHRPWKNAIFDKCISFSASQMIK